MGKAFLVKDWAGNYAGQTLTNVAKGTIPADVAEYYEDDQIAPGDVVKTDATGGGDPLAVKDGEVDRKKVKSVVKEKQDAVDAAQDAPAPAAVNEAEDAATQRRAKEADEFAAKQAAKAKAEKPADKPQAGKEHGVK